MKLIDFAKSSLVGHVAPERELRSDVMAYVGILHGAFMHPEVCAPSADESAELRARVAEGETATSFARLAAWAAH